MLLIGMQVVCMWHSIPLTRTTIHIEGSELLSLLCLYLAWQSFPTASKAQLRTFGVHWAKEEMVVVYGMENQNTHRVLLRKLGGFFLC
jgi:hypothetical protein